ncbi:hypothetical protein NDU88_002209 [Pleurodeles waltl]|uniref:Uncharacterized protein n=1 Tax=Pleurodeles waltl TaxID=8319 RepID=A0AAV7P8T1_PLEWA|nr:hypothetical protein NDU88_002209 [Pleurodeles waltl]
MVKKILQGLGVKLASCWKSQGPQRLQFPRLAALGTVCFVLSKRRNHCDAANDAAGLTDAVIGRLHRAAARTATCGPRTPVSPAHTAALASPTTSLLLTPAPLPAPWPFDTAREEHEAPSHPAPQPRSTDASTIGSSVVTRHPCLHRGLRTPLVRVTKHRPVPHCWLGPTDDSASATTLPLPAP